MASAILRRVVEEASLGDVLDALARLIEELLLGFLCSILLLSEDGRHLMHSAALPPEYARAIDGFEIGPWAGSCGTAAFLGSTVIATDVATDPHWEDYRDLAMPFGLRAAGRLRYSVGPAPCLAPSRCITGSPMNRRPRRWRWSGRPPISRGS